MGWGAGFRKKCKRPGFWVPGLTLFDVPGCFAVFGMWLLRLCFGVPPSFDTVLAVDRPETTHGEAVSPFAIKPAAIKPVRSGLQCSPCTLPSPHSTMNAPHRLGRPSAGRVLQRSETRHQTFQPSSLKPQRAAAWARAGEVKSHGTALVCGDAELRVVTSCGTCDAGWPTSPGIV